MNELYTHTDTHCATLFIESNSPPSRPPHSLKTGIKNLKLLKTTQSGFENFHSDEFRALPDTNDRLVGTSVEGEWTFSQATIASRPDYEALNKQVLDTLIDEFAGPADKGVYSVSVQQTLYDMGVGVLRKVAGVEKVELDMVRGLG